MGRRRRLRYSWSKFFGAASKSGISEEGFSIAVGNVVHMLLLISKFTDIPLKYDLQYAGSRSHVIDHLNITTWKQILGQMGSPSPSEIAGDPRDRFQIGNRKRDGVQVSLFIMSKGSKDSRVYFDYGLFLLNQVIAQIKWTLSLLAPAQFPTLRNQADRSDSHAAQSARHPVHLLQLPDREQQQLHHFVSCHYIRRRLRCSSCCDKWPHTFTDRLICGRIEEGIAVQFPAAAVVRQSDGRDGHVPEPGDSGHAAQ